jgi:translation initiation factor IF-1
MVAAEDIFPFTHLSTNKESPIAPSNHSHSSGRGRGSGPGQRRPGGRPGGAPGAPRPPRQEPAGPRVSKDGKTIEVDGTIKQVLAGTMFKVEITGGHEVLAHISGKMRKRFIRLVAGDIVRMEMSPYDTTKGRIVFRMR